MINYSLDIREHNKQAHADLESDIKNKKAGQFTFILRVNNGNIVDYSVMEYVDATKYMSVKKVATVILVK